jgi:hypothetical protein
LHKLFSYPKVFSPPRAARAPAGLGNADKLGGKIQFDVLSCQPAYELVERVFLSCLWKFLAAESGPSEQPQRQERTAKAENTADGAVPGPSEANDYPGLAGGQL